MPHLLYCSFAGTDNLGTLAAYYWALEEEDTYLVEAVEEDTVGDTDYDTRRKGRYSRSRRVAGAAAGSAAEVEEDSPGNRNCTGEAAGAVEDNPSCRRGEVEWDNRSLEEAAAEAHCGTAAYCSCSNCSNRWRAVRFSFRPDSQAVVGTVAVEAALTRKSLRRCGR